MRMRSGQQHYILILCFFRLTEGLRVGAQLSGPRLDSLNYPLVSSIWCNHHRRTPDIDILSVTLQLRAQVGLHVCYMVPMASNLSCRIQQQIYTSPARSPSAAGIGGGRRLTNQDLCRVLCQDICMCALWAWKVEASSRAPAWLARTHGGGGWSQLGMGLLACCAYCTIIFGEVDGSGRDPDRELRWPRGGGNRCSL
jgi:hypothetical protein